MLMSKEIKTILIIIIIIIIKVKQKQIRDFGPWPVGKLSGSIHVDQSSSLEFL